MKSMSWRLRAVRASEDGGFSLVESVVALLIATVLFGALTAAAISSVQASLTSRANQQATDFMTRELEAARKMSFASLGHTSADLAGDSLVTSAGCSSTQCFLAPTGTKEAMVVLASGAGYPAHKTTLSTVAQGTNNISFTLGRYVTAPAGQDVTQVKRVTVVAQWTAYGRTHTRTTSTLIALAQIGLPLPSFKLTPVGSQSSTVNPGATVVFGARLSNQGATDRWNLALTSTLIWSLLKDDGDGAFDATLDTQPVADTNGDGVPDTGAILPADDVVFWLVTTTDGSQAVGTYPLTVTATSVGQPTATTAAQSLAYSAVLTSGVVTPTATPSTSTTTPAANDCLSAAPSALSRPGSYSQLQWSPHNGLPAGDTTSLSQLSMNATGPYASSLYAYSLPSTSSGRTLQPDPTGDLTGTDATKYVDWRNQIVTGNSNNAQGGSFKGGTRLRVWVAAPVGGTVNLKVLVYSATASGTKTLLAQQVRSFTGWTCSGYQDVYIDSGDIGTVSVANNGYFGVRVVNTGTDAVRLAYDVSGAYPASFLVNNK